MGPISELDMEYSMDCYFRQRWTDKRLMFDGPFNNLSLNIKMLGDIWKPDTYFYNGRGSYLHINTQPNKLLRIYKNGEVLYSMRLTIKARCPMQLHRFPMDKQSCPLILGSYAYSKEEMVYRWDPNGAVSLTDGMLMSQFDLIEFPCQNLSVDFRTGLLLQYGDELFANIPPRPEIQTANHFAGIFSVLQVNFILRRHTGYFLIQVYVPCVLIVVLSWVSFWINREATADRVGLGITTFLTLSTFGLDTRTDLPKVPYPTALDWFVIMCFVYVVFTLLESAGVHYFTKIGSGEAPPTAIETLAEMTVGAIPELHLIPHPKEIPIPEVSSSEEMDDECYTTETHDINCKAYNRRPDHLKINSSFKGLKVSKARRLAKCCLQFANCITANEEYRAKMRAQGLENPTDVNSVSMIDKTSRILFPVSFIMLNLIYWYTYGKEHYVNQKPSALI